MQVETQDLALFRTVDAALRNWGNWARVRPHYGHCFSIEHRYVHPQNRHWNPPQPRVEVDLLSALQVERTMRHIPYLHRLALKLVYVYRVPGRTARRAVCVPHDLWAQFLANAQRMVANRLTLLTVLKSRRILRASTDSPPALVEPDGSACYGAEGTPA